MSDPWDRLPVADVLPAVAAALTGAGQVVLQAPPGAGKTTGVPLYLMTTGAVRGRIVMLEPRRVAARSAATYMAASLGEPVGARIGYRMRGAQKTSSNTVVEVVTEGVLTRMIQDDPELAGVGCVIFDEFHERSLHADLGLALVLEARSALRPDLALVVMSATLDAGPVAALMGGAPVVTAAGRSFAVDTRWLPAPWRSARMARFEPAMAGLVRDALSATEGSVLAFLPGAGEIRRVAGMLDGVGARIVPLYGALPFADQMRALTPAEPGTRHLILATAIAETSLTIPDVRVVVDGGLARRPRYDPGSGMTRLVTERVAKAEAEQRAGRAGRVAPGVCYRLWTPGEHGGLAPHAPVAITESDLAGLALELAAWGVADAGDLPFLTAPPAPALAAARALLATFGALDGGGAITAHGRALARLPLHPRLAQMVLRGRAHGRARTAAAAAALLEARRAGAVDLEQEVRQARTAGGDLGAQIRRIGGGPDTGNMSVGAVLSLAYPDRIGRRRPGAAGRYLLSGGRGAVLADGDLGAPEWLVAADLDGAGRDARVRGAAPITEAEVRTLHADRVTTEAVCAWDKRAAAVLSQVEERLGAVVLSAKPAAPDGAAVAAAMLDGVRALGLEALPWTKAARQVCARAVWARGSGADLPDMSPAALTADVAVWLGPFVAGMNKRADLARLDLVAALGARLGWAGGQTLDKLAPARFRAPTGTSVAIDYAGPAPKISIRLQEMLGTTVHPTVGADRVPLLVELLSPAQQPIQTTQDIPGFWATSYADVRKDMRGRYPRHPWPEDPAAAPPTRRAKPKPS